VEINAYSEAVETAPNLLDCQGKARSSGELIPQELVLWTAKKADCGGYNYSLFMQKFANVLVVCR
jgi:hypothetical protein